MPNIIDIDNLLFECSRGIIEDAGQEHRPLVLAFPPDPEGQRVIDVSVPMSDQSGKAIVSTLISDLGRTGLFDVIAFVGEGWQVVLPANSPEARGLKSSAWVRTDHRRVEVLTISYSLRGGERAGATHVIVRDGNRRRLERGKLRLGRENMLGQFFAEVMP